MYDQLLNLFRLTRREYFADFFITPPLTVALAVVSLRNATLLWPILCAAGLIVWTLYEYLVHRFVSHKVFLLRDAHFLHHAHQQDYIAVHPFVTIALYVFMWAVFGVHSSAFMVGFSVGYIVYSAMHTIFHFAHITKGHLFFNYKRRHALHHQFENVNFGVTSSMWDHLFGTER